MLSRKMRRRDDTDRVDVELSRFAQTVVKWVGYLVIAGATIVACSRLVGLVVPYD